MWRSRSPLPKVPPGDLMGAGRWKAGRFLDLKRNMNQPFHSCIGLQEWLAFLKTTRFQLLRKKTSRAGFGANAL